MGPSAEPERTASPIDGAMNNLSSALDNLEDKVQRLTNRLKPVLGEQLPKDPGEKAVPTPPPPVKLVEKIINSERYAKMIGTRVNDLLDRLQV